MQKINRTTGDRAQDEDWRRVYEAITTLQEDVKGIKSTPTPNIEPTPPGPPTGLIAATTVTPVESTDVVGNLLTFAREDHAHAGVSSVGGATGGILVGSGLTLTGNTLSASGGGGFGPPTKIAVASSPYTPPASNVVIFANTVAGAITVNLPAASMMGVIVIGNTGTVNPVTVGGATGITTITNTTGFTFVWYISDGTNWYSFTNSGGN